MLLQFETCVRARWPLQNLPSCVCISLRSRLLNCFAIPFLFVRQREVFASNSAAAPSIQRASEEQLSCGLRWAQISYLEPRSDHPLRGTALRVARDSLHFVKIRFASAAWLQGVFGVGGGTMPAEANHSPALTIAQGQSIAIR